MILTTNLLIFGTSELSLAMAELLMNAAIPGGGSMGVS